MAMKKEYEDVIEFLGEDWFATSWKEFRIIQNKSNRSSFLSSLVLAEIALHPLLVDVFKYQDLISEELDFSLIKPGSPSDFSFSHLGRDIALLKKEIKERGSQIKKDLLRTTEYESHRFNLLVAAGYKIQGYNVEFVPPSSKEKRADLFVTNSLGTFNIENKRLNQQISDQPRYEYFAKLVQKTFKLLRLKNLTYMVVGVDVKGRIDKQKELVDKAISHKVWRNQNFKSTPSLAVKFSNLRTDSELFTFLQRQGHFNETPVYTRAEDFLIASDPINHNVILLNKNVSPLEIPSRVKSLLEDANMKEKHGNNLIVYLDIGRGMTEWNKNVSDYLMEIVSKPEEVEYPNIDSFVICQTSLKFLGDKVQIKPDFNLIGNTAKLGGKPEDFNLFGFQGHTGMDNYLIKEFLNPEPYSDEPGQKYIECRVCGNKIIGLATNLRERELLSQVPMPCDRCGGHFDMTIKIT